MSSSSQQARGSSWTWSTCNAWNSLKTLVAFLPRHPRVAPLSFAALWSFSAWDSWRTTGPCVHLPGREVVLPRLSSVSFFSFVAFQPRDAGVAVATEVLKQSADVSQEGQRNRVTWGAWQAWLSIPPWSSIIPGGPWSSWQPRETSRTLNAWLSSWSLGARSARNSYPWRASLTWGPMDTGQASLALWPTWTRRSRISV